MAVSVVLTKTTSGIYYIVEKDENGITINEKPFVAADFTVTCIYAQYLIKLVPPEGHYSVMFIAYAPEAWTIDGVTGFTTTLEVAEAITALANK